MKGFSNCLNVSTISVGALAAIFGCTGPALIIINRTTNRKISERFVAIREADVMHDFWSPVFLSVNV
jgi:hypothetical protein